MVSQLATGHHRAGDGVQPHALTVGAQRLERVRVRRLELRDLADPAHVALLTRESRPQKGTRDLDRQLLAGDALAQAEHVGVVVLHRLVAGVGVFGGEGIHAGNLVRRDRHARARPADGDASVGVSAHDRFANRRGGIRVVGRRRGGVHAEVRERQPVLVRQALDEQLFELETGVV